MSGDYWQTWENYYHLNLFDKSSGLSRSNFVTVLALLVNVILTADQTLLMQVLAVEPEGKNLGECLSSRKRLWPNPPQFLNTIAEGIMTQQATN